MIRIFIVFSTLVLFVAGPTGLPGSAYCEETRADGGFWVPAEAIRLLAKSRKESCSVCVENLKGEAFEILAESMKPYKIISAEKNCPLFFSSIDGEPEIQLSCYPEILNLSEEISEIPGLVLRFHTGKENMVGISPEDFTDENIAGYISSFSRNTVFDGELELVPYRYGDGPAFIYFSETNRLSIQCRILKINVVD